MSVMSKNFVKGAKVFLAFTFLFLCSCDFFEGSGTKGTIANSGTAQDFLAFSKTCADGNFSIHRSSAGTLTNLNQIPVNSVVTVKGKFNSSECYNGQSAMFTCQARMYINQNRYLKCESGTVTSGLAPLNPPVSQQPTTVNGMPAVTATPAPNTVTQAPLLNSNSLLFPNPSYNSFTSVNTNRSFQSGEIIIYDNGINATLIFNVSGLPPYTHWPCNLNMDCFEQP